MLAVVHHIYVKYGLQAEFSPKGIDKVVKI